MQEDRTNRPVAPLDVCPVNHSPLRLRTRMISSCSKETSSWGGARVSRHRGTRVGWGRAKV